MARKNVILQDSDFDTLDPQTAVEQIKDTNGDSILSANPTTKVISGANSYKIEADALISYPTLSDFPVTGEAGKIYLAEDTNYMYRWNTSAYAQIGGGDAPVTSVNNKTGAVVLGISDIINAQNLLSSDLVDDTGHTNKFVTASEKSQITANESAISAITNGAVINTFGGVETALSGKEDTSNKVTEISASSTNDQYPSAKAVYDAIDELPEPMIFKGSLGEGGTITSLPTASPSNEGFTYKVITAGTYASQAAKIGDVFISNGSAWVLIPSGDEPSGTVTNVGAEGASGSHISVSGSPITSSGTLTVGVESGYSIPSTSDQTRWDDKYTKDEVETLIDTYGVASLSASFSGSEATVAPAASGSATYTPAGSVSLGSNTTSTDGVAYVESVSYTSASAGNKAKAVTDVSGGVVTDTTKYLHFSAGTTPASSASPTHTSTASGANSGTKVTAVTGYPNFSGGSGSFTPTTRYLSASFSGSAVTSGNNSGSAVKAYTGHTFTAGTTPPASAAPTHTATDSGANSGAAIKAVTGYGSFSGGSGSFTPTTKYLSAGWTGTKTNSLVTSVVYGSNTHALYGSRSTSGTNYNYRRTLEIKDYALSVTKGDYTPAGSVSLTANASTATGRITYIESATHSHTGASLGTPTTGNCAPSAHTHSYDKTTGITLTAGTAPSITFTTTNAAPHTHTHSVTAGGSVSLTANESTDTGRIKYIQEASHSHTGASLGTANTGDCAPNAHTHSYDKTTGVTLTAGTAPSLETNTTASGGIEYVEETSQSALSVTKDTDFLTSITAGSMTPTTKYFHPSFTGTGARLVTTAAGSVSNTITRPTVSEE